MLSNRFLAVAVVALVVAVAALAAAGTAVLLSRSGSRPPVSGPIQGVVAADPGTVTVQGAGSGSTVPDEARIEIGVAPARPNVHDANAVAADEANRLLNSLHEQGVADADIQTTSLGVQQQTNCCPQHVTGYMVSTFYAVKIHHLANVSSVIAAAVDAVGNDIRINQISLSSADPSAAIKAARTAAMADASRRAKTWAELAGKKVGPMHSVSEAISSQPQPICTGGCGGGGSPPVQAGQSTVSVSVVVVYELS